MQWIWVQPLFCSLVVWWIVLNSWRFLCGSAQRKRLFWTINWLEELTNAFHKMPTGQVPGTDGLATDLFQRIWVTTGADIHDAYLESLRTGSPLVSCKWPVLFLLPHTEDLALLKNWRPEELLCTDYKLLSRHLSNRLKDMLGPAVNMDHSYCVLKKDNCGHLFLFFLSNGWILF